MNLLRRLFHRRRLDADLDRELRFHVDEETRRLGRELPPTEARRQALASFGGLEPMKDATRDARGTRWIEDLVRDLTLAGRMMRRSPGFALTAVVSLAVGIGANAAIFSISDALLRRPLPIARPDELYFLSISDGTDPFSRFSGPDLDRLRTGVPEATFTALTEANRVQVDLDGSQRLLVGQLVDGNWFSTLGVGAAAGRVFSADDTRALGQSPVVVLSHAFWDRQFGRDPRVIGTSVVINGIRLEIIGVASAGFDGLSVGETVDVWLPITLQYELRYRSNSSVTGGDPTKAWYPQRGIAWLTVAVRVPAATTAATIARIKTVERTALEQAAASEADPADRADLLRYHPTLEPGARGQSALRDRFSASLSVLAVTVALVLLIACANLASLLLARSSARSREFALRASIGARRGRLVRQMLTESVFLALVGGLLGVVVAWWGAHALLQLASSSAAPIPLAIRLDWRLIAFAIATSVATGVLFGLGPALRLSRPDVHDALRPGTRVVSGHGGWLSLGRLLVVGQVALSLALLIGATLFVRTMGHLLATDLGFDQTAVVGARFDALLAGVPPEEWPDLRRRIVESVASIPGVISASLALNGPLSGGARTSDIQIEGQAARAGRDGEVREDYIGPSYFATLGTQLAGGRDFAPTDDDRHPKVAIVSEAMARHFFGSENPVGKRYGYDVKATIEIVGVVRDAMIDGATRRPPLVVFYPLAQYPAEAVRHVYIRVGSAAAAEALPASVRDAIHRADRRIAVPDVATLEQLSERTLTINRIVSQLTGVFGLVAVAVACLGLYGTLSYAVSRRAKEMGVRLALGSAPGALCWMVLRDALTMVAVGCAVGLGLAWLGLASVAALLYGLSPRDPATFAAATGLFVVVATIAAAVPAVRAARVDPLTALRAE